MAAEATAIPLMCPASLINIMHQSDRLSLAGLSADYTSPNPLSRPRRAATRRRYDFIRYRQLFRPYFLLNPSLTDYDLLNEQFL